MLQVATVVVVVGTNSSTVSSGRRALAWTRAGLDVDNACVQVQRLIIRRRAVAMSLMAVRR